MGCHKVAGLGTTCHEVPAYRVSTAYQSQASLLAVTSHLLASRLNSSFRIINSVASQGDWEGRGGRLSCALPHPELLMIFFGPHLWQEVGSQRGTHQGEDGPLWGLLALPGYPKLSMLPKEACCPAEGGQHQRDVRGRTEQGASGRF